MSEPSDLDRLAPWLRNRVAELRSSTRRRSFPLAVEVVPLPGGGIVGDRRTHSPVGRALDRGLQVDLLCRLMAGTSAPVAVVVVRPGHHATRTEADTSWVGAARAATDIAGLPLVGVAMLSRWGWLELLSDERRDWKRLRLRAGSEVR